MSVVEIMYEYVPFGRENEYDVPVIAPEFTPLLRLTYHVYPESGLPSGTTWSVTLNGTTKNSTSSTISFTESGLAANTTWYVNLSDGIKSGPITGTSFTLNLTNGTYTYTVSNVTGYTNLAPSGNISVNDTE